MMKITVLLVFCLLATSYSAKLRNRRFVNENIPDEDVDDNKNGGFVRGDNNIDVPSEEDKNKNNIVNEKESKPDIRNGIEIPPETGTFWHLTDLHWDPYYNLNAASPSQICPSSNGQTPINPGPYGDYR